MSFYSKLAMLFPFFCALIFCGCYTYKPISQEQIGDSFARVRLATKENLPRKYPRISVEVNSSDFKTYYLFFGDKIFKQTFKGKSSILYELNFEQEPNIPISSLDSMVFSRVFQISDSLNVSDIFDFKYATGFGIEKIHK